MTNEEHIKKLTDILAEATETDNAVCYVTSDDKETLEAAISALSQPDLEAIRQEIKTYGSLTVEYSLNPLFSAEIRDIKVSDAEKYIDKCVDDIVADVLKQAKDGVLDIIDKHIQKPIDIEILTDYMRGDDE